eukprot:gnl/Hemi2/7157_TR2445_c0_g2_i1.p1 gnl/Hemi2/7157_TR2445_c0_g2~~gnl/Hemi2/7157_TR2445_c0_g2_i1.p1  ORF type:complete len:426 (+),score=131.59 gnl/Hemi2/7157_TR2445_c0_g2_i1:52-1329(+)
MRCVLLVLVSLVSLCVVVQATWQDVTITDENPHSAHQVPVVPFTPTAASTTKPAAKPAAKPKQAERHIHIFHRPDAAGRLSLPLVHVSDSPIVSFAQLEELQQDFAGTEATTSTEGEPQADAGQPVDVPLDDASQAPLDNSNMMSADMGPAAPYEAASAPSAADSAAEFERGRAEGLAEARAEAVDKAYEEKRKFAAHAALGLATARAGAQSQASAQAQTQAGPTDPPAECKFPKTHVHFYMPHTGPVSPLMMMPFMHPSATWGAGFGMFGGMGLAALDITPEADRKASAKAERKMPAHAPHAPHRAPHRISAPAIGGWSTVDMVSLDVIADLEAAKAEADAPTNSESESGPTPPPADPCDKVPQMHLHIFDPASGHRAAAASVAAASYPYQPMMGMGLAAPMGFGLGYHPYGPYGYAHPFGRPF